MVLNRSVCTAPSSFAAERGDYVRLLGACQATLFSFASPDPPTTCASTKLTGKKHCSQAVDYSRTLKRSARGSAQFVHARPFSHRIRRGPTDSGGDTARQPSWRGRRLDLTPLLAACKADRDRRLSARRRGAFDTPVRAALSYRASNVPTRAPHRADRAKFAGEAR